MPGRPRRDLEEHRPGDLERRDGGRPERRSGDAGDFWRGIGVDVDVMSPRGQVYTSLALLVPVVGGLLAVFAFLPWLWWLVFVVGWVVFPAFGLLLRGVAGLTEGGGGEAPGPPRERELLAALREHGELTPAQVAMETSLTVAEADRMLRDLASAGHLDVRVRGGGLFYALWEGEEGART